MFILICADILEDNIWAQNGHLQVWWYQGLYKKFWPPDDEDMVLERCRGMK